MAQTAGQRDGWASSSDARCRPLSWGEAEGVACRGPRSVFVHKNSQGFGFTLRHFIVYPPDAPPHAVTTDEENGNPSGKGGQRPLLEPMDTIFVKSIKDQSPAEQAGLRAGDRLVRVNGETILGKTYSQVIGLIQTSGNILELSIVPKDEDVMQLDAEQSDPSSCRLPEPPPPSHPSPAAPCWAGGPRARSSSSSSASALDFHFSNHSAAVTSATLPPPRKSSLSPPSLSSSSVCHRALSDWYYSQAPPPALPPARADRQRHTLQFHHQVATAAASHEPQWPRGRGDVPPAPPTQGLLAAYGEYERCYGRSVEALAQASSLIASPGGPGGQQVAELQAWRGRVATRLPQPLLDPTGEGGSRGERLPLLPPSQQQQEEEDKEEEAGLRLRSLRAAAHAFHRRDNGTLTGPGSSGSTSSGTPASGDHHGVNGNLATPAHDPLSHIPFIDEPGPVDPRPCVVRSSPTPPPNVSVTTATPTHSSSIVRLRSQDCSSLKGRRSSYLLAITTERSRSCDEGLNTFREESRVFTRLPKRVKSFFTDGSLESLRAQADARSKRHSTSELGTITFSNVRKEGWLHYKQILTEKGKKVGGGMRPWRRVFCVLRSHSLFLYKDKREAVLHGAGAGPAPDEHSQPIGMRGCLVDIAYSETRRKHALRLTTQDYCEHLLQAEDRDDMLAWIRAIRDGSKTDSEEMGFSRQALINKKLNDYRKQCPTGNKPESSPRAQRMMPPFLLAKTDNAFMNRSLDDIKTLWGINLMKKPKKAGGPKAFGVRLEDCQPGLHHKFVPLTVETCCGLVEASGLHHMGIYRVPGNNAMVSSLQEHLNKGLDINTAEERWQDLNVISSLLKSFFRKLPEPLFTDGKYNDFIDANRIVDAGNRLNTMKKLIHNLPDHYHHTLKFLVGHLKKVADNAERNKMEARNLALVFGPTLVRTSQDNMMDMVTHMPDRYKIVETLILHHDWFFGEGVLDEDDQAPEDKRDSQPVPNIDHLLPNIGRVGMPGDASDSPASSSVKSKLSPGRRKELSAPRPLALPSASTRKRKKRLGSPAAEQGSSTDEPDGGGGDEEEDMSKQAAPERDSQGAQGAGLEVPPANGRVCDGQAPGPAEGEAFPVAGATHLCRQQPVSALLRRRGGGRAGGRVRAASMHLGGRDLGGPFGVPHGALLMAPQQAPPPAIALRRAGLQEADRRRGWRRHTLVV